MRVAVAVLLGAAALLCTGLWIAGALSRPSPGVGAWVLYDGSAAWLRLSRYDLAVRLTDDAQLRLWCFTRACLVCGYFPPDHAPDSGLGAGSTVYPSSYNFDAVGLAYYDYRAAPAGLIWFVLRVPLWLLIALLAPYPLYVLVRALLLRRSRRRPGACVACGYDLTGNVSGVCPECGRPAVQVGA